MLPDLVFDPGPHTYRVQGAYYPSVTKVLEPLIDFSYLSPSRREAVMERGRLVHDAIDLDNRRDLDDAVFRLRCPDLVPYVDAWRSFRDARRFVPTFGEYRLASVKYRVAGTADAIGLMDGHAALVDYKTGNPRDVAADLQTGAYLGLALEWAALGDTALAEFFRRYPVIRRYAVQLKADGTFRVEAYTDPSDYRNFQTLLAAFHLITGRRGKYTEAA